MKTLNKMKPINASSRGVILVNKRHLYKGGPKSSLTKRIASTGGRNNQGVITCRHMGGGHKRIYRIIDFYRKIDGIPAIVERIEYDPNRTGFIALIKYETGQYSYILAPEKLKVGDIVESGDATEVSTGNCMLLENIPLGTIIHNVELFPGSGAKLCRSAGAFAVLVGKEGGYAILKLPREVRKVSLKCRASIGMVSNIDNFNEVIGKAGRNRNRGIRPTTRGVAMNPVDHPNGGRTHGGKVFRNPSGRICKGLVTRKKGKKSDNLIVSKKRRNK
jgi:large subunit ribosomal protein L2